MYLGELGCQLVIGGVMGMVLYNFCALVRSVFRHVPSLIEVLIIVCTRLGRYFRVVLLPGV
jgi:hypothetical protein